jgi:hypothetical protein
MPTVTAEAVVTAVVVAGETLTTLRIHTSTMPKASTRVHKGPVIIIATTIRVNTIMNAVPYRQR